MAPTGTRVGFAGLGAMGFGMAFNLLENGIAIVAFDLNPSVLERFTAIGGSVSKTVAEASKGQQVFLVMVATPGQVDNLVFSEAGLASSLPMNAALCLLSTLPPRYICGLPARLAEKGRADIRLLDCPVSGGVVGAEAGTLSIMIGGERHVFDEVKPILQAMSAPDRLFYCGALGSGSTLKMLNQLLAGAHIVVAAEVLSFAKCLGLSTRETHRTVMNSVSSSWIFGDRGKLMLDADWTPRSAVTIFTKDLGIVTSSAKEAGFRCPIASAALEAFQDRLACGHGHDDDSSVVCNYEQTTGNPVREHETPVSPPKSPDRTHTGVTPSKLVGMSVIPGHNDDPPSFAIDVSRDLKADDPVLAVLYGPESATEATLQEALDGSVIAIHGFRSPKEARTIFIFSAEDNDLQQAVASVMPRWFNAVPVSGPIGSASAIHICIRLGSLVHLAAAAECYGLARTQGTSIESVYRLIAGAAGSSHQFNVSFQDMARRDFKPKSESGFDTLQKAIADLHSIKKVAESLQFPGKLLETSLEVFEGASLKLNKTEASVAAR
ncbi:ketose-bisphosphate aldolase class-ii-like protein [Colletotrichum musicola]|uniref:Ketose-bisphosphate aldolase class-ii-like protein n=1 Tax=Colletotrichum musicola TaxID=2175873 RepID=A0A8H6IZA5_9PEZI|nr:ketose-bisphosphate aldolase class-ii-like protein [Colletotrichum musicola]